MDGAKSRQIINGLKGAYPSAECELNYKTPFQLLVAVILSAQCTDKRVNEVTKGLFKRWDKPLDFANLKQEELQKEIYSCGFYRNKALSIIDASRDIIERFNGDVPDTLEQLTSLKGVGRKTANVVLSVAFNKQTMAVDTHVFRVSRRLNFSEGNTPYAVEKDLNTLFAQENLTQIHHLLIFHGRYCCKSQKPLCHQCPVYKLCASKDKTVGAKTQETPQKRES